MDLEPRVARAEALLRWHRRGLWVLAFLTSSVILAGVWGYRRHLDQVAELESDADALRKESEELRLDNYRKSMLLPMITQPRRRLPGEPQPSVRGTVELAEMQWNRVRVNAGRDDDVLPGDVFRVFRVEQPLGTLIAVEVGFDWMSGYFVPDVGARSYPRAGDAIAGGEQ